MSKSQPNYSELIDAETWAFIEATSACYPADTLEQSIARQREIYNAMCRHFNAGRPKSVVTRDYTIDADSHAIPVRHYYFDNAKPTAHIVYYHGGGFVVGDLESHDDVCAEICARTGLDVTAVDYRLAPEHLHPAPFEDALTAYREIASGELPVILAGDSAGGNLAAAVSHKVRGNGPQPIGQLLIYPALDNETNHGSYLEHAYAPMLTTEDIEQYYELLTGNDIKTADPTLLPLADDNFSDLPATVVFTAQCDPLASDGPKYCERIIQAGGKALCIEEAGLTHGYLRARHSVQRAKDSFTRIILAFKENNSGGFAPKKSQ